MPRSALSSKRTCSAWRIPSVRPFRACAVGERARSSTCRPSTASSPCPLGYYSATSSPSKGSPRPWRRRSRRSASRCWPSSPAASALASSNATCAARQSTPIAKAAHAIVDLLENDRDGTLAPSDPDRIADDSRPAGGDRRHAAPPHCWRGRLGRDHRGTGRAPGRVRGLEGPVARHVLRVDVGPLGRAAVASSIGNGELRKMKRIGFVEWPDGLLPEGAAWDRIASDLDEARPDVLVTNELPFGEWIASTPIFDAAAAAASVEVHRRGVEALLLGLGIATIVSSRPVWERRSPRQRSHRHRARPGTCRSQEAVFPRRARLARDRVVWSGFLGLRDCRPWVASPPGCCCARN